MIDKFVHNDALIWNKWLEPLFAVQELGKLTMKSGKQIEEMHFKYTISISSNHGDRRFL